LWLSTGAEGWARDVSEDIAKAVANAVRYQATELLDGNSVAGPHVIYVKTPIQVV